MHYVNVLWRNKLKKQYIGSTGDILKRLEQHNHGKTPFTSLGIPWVLVHKEEYSTSSDARKRESYLKSGEGRSWLDKTVRIK